MTHRALVCLTALLLAACASPVRQPPPEPAAPDPGEIAAPAGPPPARPPAAGINAERVMQNYERLLDLPQSPTDRAETMRRLADLQLEQEEAGGAGLADGEKRLRKSIALYEKLLAEQPSAPGRDRVLYQLSRAYQNVGEVAKAEATLARMVQEFPDSPYSDDARFRRAELLFRMGQFEAASAEYEQVLQRTATGPLFEPAQYKFGWCQYKLANFPRAIETFLAILDRELPPGELTDPEAAIAGARPGKKDVVKDALRVTSLALDAIGGGDAVNAYFAKRPEPGYAPLLYVALAEYLLEKNRYSDVANAYLAFVQSHPSHPLAPAFQMRVIAAVQAGGFTERVVQEKERYVKAYDPQAEYYASGRSPAPEVLSALRAHLEDLARHYQAQGQKSRDRPDARSRENFMIAAARYRRLLELFPQDPQAAELRFLMAESYYDAGDALSAAREYGKVVSDHPEFARAADAAHAAVLALYRHAADVPPTQRAEAVRQAVQASLQLVARFPQHPQGLTLLTRSAEELYQLELRDEAIAIAARVLKATPPAPDALRRTAWGVTADAHFSQKRYGEAELAYGELLKLTPANAEGRPALVERLASSIYKQGEAARSANDLKAAANAFLRVERVAPGAAIRAAAVYDAAAALMDQNDWASAISVLESFRATFRGHPRLPDVDKKLATAYRNDGKYREAAGVLKRISARAEESPDTRRDAAWLAASLLDQVKDPQAAAELEAYVKQYPQPVDRAVEARQRLADLAGARGAAAQRVRWLQAIIAADRAARTPFSQQRAAHAALELAIPEARSAGKIPLRLPLKASLPVKKRAMERALAALTAAVEYGVAEVTTAAAYELGDLYYAFGKSLLASERPRGLSAVEADQYRLMLEDQAFPFEEKAIQWHESNVQRVAQGVNDEWVSKSLRALADIVPARYGKRELAAELYDPKPVPQAEPGAGTAAAGTVVGARTAPRARYVGVLDSLRAGQWQVAETELAAVIADFPQDSGLRTNLGIVYARTQRKDLAAREFSAAVAIAPDNAAAHNWLGVLAREAGDFRRAEEAYRRALEADPAYAIAHLNLGILYDQYQRRPQEALVEYRLYRERAGTDDPRAAVWIADLERLAPSAQVPAANSSGAAGKPALVNTTGPKAAGGS